MNRMGKYSEMRVKWKKQIKIARTETNQCGGDRVLKQIKSKQRRGDSGFKQKPFEI